MEQCPNSSYIPSFKVDRSKIFQSIPDDMVHKGMVYHLTNINLNLSEKDTRTSTQNVSDKQC